MEQLREKVRRASASFGITYEELAEASGYATSTLETYLSGAREGMGPESKQRFIQAIEAALSRLVESRVAAAKDFL